MSTAPDTHRLVFAGGSSLGAIQVDMLKALLAGAWQADMVVGSSVGAINAARFAGDPTLAGVAALQHIWRGMRRVGVFPAHPVKSVIAPCQRVVPISSIRRGWCACSNAICRTRASSRPTCRSTSSPPTCSWASGSACRAARQCRRCWRARQFLAFSPPYSCVRWGYPATLALDAAFGLVMLALLPLMTPRPPEEPATEAAAARAAET